MEVETHVHTYGSAPKKYNGATKVGATEVDILKTMGWEHIGRGASYHYMMAPSGGKKSNPKLTIEVPEVADLVELAEAFHARKTHWDGSFSDVPMSYRHESVRGGSYDGLLRYSVGEWRVGVFINDSEILVTTANGCYSNEVRTEETIKR